MGLPAILAAHRATRTAAGVLRGARDAIVTDHPNAATTEQLKTGELG